MNKRAPRATATATGGRRWWSAPPQGTAADDAARLAQLDTARRALLKPAADGRTCRLAPTYRRMGRWMDAVQVDEALWALCDAGLVLIAERRDGRGDWAAYQWRLSDAAQASLSTATGPEDAPDIEGWIASISAATPHPIVAQAAVWMRAAGTAASPRTLRVVMAVVEAAIAGEHPTGGGVWGAVPGASTGRGGGDYRAAMEAATGRRLADLVELHTRAVYVYGPLSFTVADRRVHADWSVPWLALTEDALDAMTDVRLDCDEVRTIENLTPFEHVVRADRPTDAILVYTGGNPGRAERQLLQRLVTAGARRVRHWGDLDVGGLRILRHLRAILEVPVMPWRMDPRELSRSPTRPLTDAERTRLQAMSAGDDPVVAGLAAALLDAGCKLEQEAQLVGNSRG